MALPRKLFPVTKVAERPGSGKITFSKSGLSATRMWVVPWWFPNGSTYLNYVSQLLGETLTGPNYTPIIAPRMHSRPNSPSSSARKSMSKGKTSGAWTAGAGPLIAAPFSRPSTFLMNWASPSTSPRR